MLHAASLLTRQTCGLAVGTIGSGALVQYGPRPCELVYLVAVGLLLLSIALSHQPGNRGSDTGR